MTQCKHDLCDNIATYGRQCQPCRNYLHRYKLTAPQVEKLLQDQNGLCSLCSRPVTLGRYKGVVDHSHKTTEVRSILCHDCNVVVGYVENRNQFLGNLVNYLTS